MVKVHPSHLAGGQDNGVIGGHFLDIVHGHPGLPIQGIQVMNVPLLQHFHKFHKDFRRTPGVVHRPVVVEKRHLQRLCHRVQLKAV